MKKLAIGRILFFGFAAAAGFAALVYGEPLIKDNEDAAGVVTTVFSILAGFLIAIMSVLGDPSLILPGSWRKAEIQRSMISARLIRQKWLFYLYLITLTSVFAATLVKGPFPELASIIDRLYLALAVVSFILSFGLPSSLMAIQLERVEAVIQSRKNATKNSPL
jgi:hypothetical protein